MKLCCRDDGRRGYGVVGGDGVSGGGGGSGAG